MRILVTLLLLASTASADDGIWLFNSFPAAIVKSRYGFSADEAFLTRLRLGSVRVGDGSGSFVSPEGLIFTNHHIASECLQKLSTPSHDLMRDGFHAASRAGERPCPAMDAEVLLEIEDLTARVNGAAAGASDDAAANQKRKAEMTRAENECGAAAHCEVVKLYAGGAYHRYKYKRYDDVRLVFAPEASIGAFGGDPDNFTYPRFCLDISFLRAYENGAPAKTPNYLHWSKTGVKEGELTFVVGNPGTTGRLETLAALEFYRDYQYPYTVRSVGGLIDALKAFGQSSKEAHRVSQDNLFMQQNSFKAYTGFLAGLEENDLMARKRDEQQTLLAKSGGSLSKSIESVAAAYVRFRDFYREWSLFERYPGRGSDLMHIAIDVVRYPAEKAKPDDLRLREFAGPSLAVLEREMYADGAIDPPMETVALGYYFELMRKELGASHPVVTQVLAGKEPKQAAAHYVKTSKLASIAERKRLANDPMAAASSDDGMIRLARIIEAEGRKYRKLYEDQVEAVTTSGATAIAQARFQAYGESEYPDATFTPRVSFGPARGYTSDGGKPQPWATTFAGLYARATGKAPFNLPPSFVKAKRALRLDTPFNFVTTADTHGGNSGSPTVNTQGEVIGILFDGNIESLPNRFVYRERTERSVHVASQGIVEALDKVYRARDVLAELGVVTK
ncbi:MAG: S46 family peptidase [Bryobacteraceae bacterium]